MTRRPVALAVVALVAILSGPVRGQDKPAEPKPEAPPIVVELTLKGAIGEEPQPVGLEGTPVGDNLKGLIDTMAKAKADKGVKGLVLQVRDLTVGMGKANEHPQGDRRLPILGQEGRRGPGDGRKSRVHRGLRRR